MKAHLNLVPFLVLFSSGVSAASPGERSGTLAHAPIYNIEHLDVLPMAMGQVDFLKSGFAFLFKYRDQSMADKGLESFRILSLASPMTNHSEIVQSWDNYDDYLNHLAQPHTTSFRFNMQYNPHLGGTCCLGSPVDDRQYRLLQFFGTSWADAATHSAPGTSGPVFVISRVEFLPRAKADTEQAMLAHYGGRTLQANASSLMSYSILRQLDHPDRYAVLEIWETQHSYKDWQTADATRIFIASIRPILESPIDHRLTTLCGESFVANVGCVAP